MWGLGSMREPDGTVANRESFCYKCEGKQRTVALMLTTFHFPVVMFIHASLRLRNLKNKLENKMEGIGLKRTPMGIVLDALEQQEESISKFTDYISKVKE